MHRAPSLPTRGRIKKKDGRIPSPPEAADVAGVHDRGSGKGRALGVGKQNVGSLFPIHKVVTHRKTPTHGTMLFPVRPRIKGKVLIEHEPFPLMVKQAVGVAE